MTTTAAYRRAHHLITLRPPVNPERVTALLAKAAGGEA